MSSLRRYLATLVARRLDPEGVANGYGYLDAAHTARGQAIDRGALAWPWWAARRLLLTAAHQEAEDGQDLELLEAANPDALLHMVADPGMARRLVRVTAQGGDPGPMLAVAELALERHGARAATVILDRPEVGRGSGVTGHTFASQAVAVLLRAGGVPAASAALARRPEYWALPTGGLATGAGGESLLRFFVKAGGAAAGEDVVTGRLAGAVPDLPEARDTWVQVARHVLRSSSNANRLGVTLARQHPERLEVCDAKGLPLALYVHLDQARAAAERLAPAVGGSSRESDRYRAARQHEAVRAALEAPGAPREGEPTGADADATRLFDVVASGFFLERAERALHQRPELRAGREATERAGAGPALAAPLVQALDGLRNPALLAYAVRPEELYGLPDEDRTGATVSLDLDVVAPGSGATSELGPEQADADHARALESWHAFLATQEAAGPAVTDATQVERVGQGAARARALAEARQRYLAQLTPARVQELELLQDASPHLVRHPPVLWGRRPEQLGEDTADVAGALLGLSDAQVRTLSPEARRQWLSHPDRAVRLAAMQRLYPARLPGERRTEEALPASDVIPPRVGSGRLGLDPEGVRVATARASLHQFLARARDERPPVSPQLPAGDETVGAGALRPELQAVVRDLAERLGSLDEDGDVALSDFAAWTTHSNRLVRYAARRLLEAARIPGAEPVRDGSLHPDFLPSHESLAGQALAHYGLTHLRAAWRHQDQDPIALAPSPSSPPRRIGRARL